jgi:hypothetical protein
MTPRRPEFHAYVRFLWAVLKPCQDSITHLTVDIMDSASVNDRDYSPGIGDLRDFTALKHLDVSGLVLWGCDYEEDVGFRPLSSTLPTSLATLTIEKVECIWGPAPRAMAEYLINAFQELGVELVLDILPAGENSCKPGYAPEPREANAQ